MRKAVITFTCDRCKKEWFYNKTFYMSERNFVIPTGYFKNTDGEETFIRDVKFTNHAKELCHYCWLELESL